MKLPESRLFTVGIMSDRSKNGSQLEKWVTVGKMGYSFNNGSQLKKWVAVGKMGSLLE